MTDTVREPNDSPAHASSFDVDFRSDFGNRKQTTALLIPKLAGAVDGKDTQETGTLICTNCH
jgi:hypothetical protein